MAAPPQAARRGTHLFLSPRTVASHLYKAFPKLGVSSRAELSRLPGLT
ncbi:LuxR C-terminal-related transcriptional regulator [Nonomuraea sp. 10N515B]